MDDTRGAGVDVAVIGGGPAGLVCAAAVARQGHRVVCYEAAAPGGQLLNLAAIHLVPGVATPLTGVDLATSLMDAAFAAGVEIRFEQVARVRADGPQWIVDAGSPCRARAVVLATGSRPTPLGIPGAERFVGAGISYCAVCDGPLFAGRPVAVVGGGDHAVLETAHLAEFAETVIWLASGPPGRAGDDLAGRNVTVVTDAEVTEVLGDERVTGIRYVVADGSRRTANVDAVFVVVGRTPNGVTVETPDGTFHPPIATDPDLAVGGIPSLFAVGEARLGCAPSVFTALGDGLQAAALVARGEYSGSVRPLRERRADEEGRWSSR